MKPIHELDATPEACARELARRLREGIRDESTIEAAACALESMASLYERSRGVLGNAMNVVRGKS